MCGHPWKAHSEVGSLFVWLQGWTHACVALLLFLSICPFPVFCPWKGERTRREVCCLRPAECLRTPAERRKKPSSPLQDSRSSCCLISRGRLTLTPKSPILHNDPVDLIWRYGIEAWEKTGWLFRRTWMFGPHLRHFCKHLMNYTQFSSYYLKLVTNWKRNFHFKLL